MGDSVELKRCFNENLVKQVLFHKDIWPSISEDGQNMSTFMIDFVSNCFLKVVTDKGDLAGFYVLHPFNGSTLQIHANILPSFREKYAKLSGTAVLKWIKDKSPPQYHKVIALIPEIYENVYFFTKSFGFEDEGLLKQAYRKNSKLHDIHVLGIMRADL